MTSRVRKRHGMTLIELVMGVVITGLMAAAGAAAFGSIVDNRRVIVESTAEIERGAALRELLRNWIGSGTIRSQAQQLRMQAAQTERNLRVAAQSRQPTGITSAISTGDELHFTTNALTPLMTQSVNVRLFVDGDPATAERGLTIEYYASTLSALERRQLDSSIVRMTVEHLDRTTNRWVAASEGQAVRSIAVRLSFPGDSVPVPRLLQLPLVFVQSQQASQDAVEFVEVGIGNAQRGGPP